MFDFKRLKDKLMKNKEEQPFEVMVGEDFEYARLSEIPERNQSIYMRESLILFRKEDFMRLQRR